MSNTSDGEGVRRLRIFLCHSSGDKPAVRELYKRLRSDGFNPWLDEEDLIAGQDWELEITRAVKSADVVVVCLTRASVNKSGFIQKELKIALDVADMQPEGEVFIIPAKLGECDVPERIQRWHWVNLFEEDGYSRLTRSLIFRRQGLEAREAGSQYYQALATSRTPALVIYLVDVSRSMGETVGSDTKEGIVSKAIARSLRYMIRRSTKGEIVSPRYRISIYAYADTVVDILNGAKGIDEIATKGRPEFSTYGTTNTAGAFLAVENFLREEVRQMQDCPAPLILHITDGNYSGLNPVPIVRRIMGMSVRDGNVLVANLFMSDGALVKPIENIEQWPGIRTPDDLSDEYAKTLFAMSSVMPESYRTAMIEDCYSLAPGARMLFPGTYPELIELGFSLSGATPVV